MFEFKPLDNQAIPAALEKIERYRLLNEPVDAESICRDVLAVEQDNQQALMNLVLSLTDQFEERLAGRFEEARDTAAQLQGEYERAYYSGIVCERRAKAHHARATPGSGSVAHNWFLDAMDWYEKAEALRPQGNDDALLRWNTCARIVMAHPEIKPEEQTTPSLELE